MADDRLFSNPGLAQISIPRLLDMFTEQAIGLIRDDRHSVSSMDNELARLTSKYIADNQLTGAEASRLSLVSLHGAFKARRDWQNRGGRYPEREPQKSQGWTPASQARRNAEDAAHKAAVAEIANAQAAQAWIGGRPALTLPKEGKS